MLRSIFKPLSQSFRVSTTTYLPVVRFSTNLDADKARHIRYKRLVYQSQQRGWLELDLIIGSYVLQNEKSLMNDKSLDELTTLTSEENSDLIRWFVEGKPVRNHTLNSPCLKHTQAFTIRLGTICYFLGS